MKINFHANVFKKQLIYVYFIYYLQSITVESSIVDAIASGAEVKPSEGGKYPDKTPAKIVIPQPHFDIKKTAIGKYLFFLHNVEKLDLNLIFFPPNQSVLGKLHKKS